MVDFVTTFIVPYVTLIVLGLSVFNAWMLIIIAKKFFIKAPTLNDSKNTSSASQDKPEPEAADESKAKPKKKKENKGKLEEAPSFFA